MNATEVELLVRGVILQLGLPLTASPSVVPGRWNIRARAVTGGVVRFTVVHGSPKAGSSPPYAVSGISRTPRIFNRTCAAAAAVFLDKAPTAHQARLLITARGLEPALHLPQRISSK